MIQREDRTQIIEYSMLGVNVISLLLIGLLVTATSATICQSGRSLEFLRLATAIPMYPSLVFPIVCICSILLMANYYLRKFVFNNDRGKIYATITIDIILVTLVMVVTNANYNGVILWLLASLVCHIESRHSFLIIAAGTLCYMFSDFSILSSLLPLYSLHSYITWYQGSARTILFFLFYGMGAVNLAFFIIFCVLYIQAKQGTIDKVNALYQQLYKANAELKEYADIKEKMGETRERNRLAREIHDSLGHSLTGISVGIDACLAIIDKDKEGAKKQLQTISNVAKDGIADVRLSVSSLRADAVERYPLRERISRMVQRIHNATGVDIVLVFRDPFVVESYEENALFRLVQEGVTNAIRHGKATRIDILFGVEADKLVITVKDNGVGCVSFVPGFGLLNMQERIKMLHGNISFSGTNGFLIRAEIPLRKEVSFD
ncbi:MAG: sensor histidine kinase [Sphaerochaeta sp.]|nr:sensor histidine kinase [Sphaerochaeta sp.]